MMIVSFFDHPYFHTVTSAFCLTVLHSLWQGLVLVVLAGLVLMLTGKARPAVRYNLLSGLLLLFVIANCATFWMVFENEPVFEKAALPIPDDISGLAATEAPAPGRFIAEGMYMQVGRFVKNFLDEYSTHIALAWLAIFMFRSGRMVSGLLYTEKIRNTCVHPADESWSWKVRELGAKLGIYSRIGIMESEIVQVPLMQGFFRQVIIVPLGFLTSLPPEQVEAILLHELAHIRRKDYLVNFLQCLGENLYFFNPAFLWLSYLIKAEREHCCDDLVISVTGDQMSYVNALVSFKESQLAVPEAGIAFLGTKNDLLNRIKRIIFNSNKPLNAMEKFSVTTSLIAIAFFATAYLAPVRETKIAMISASSEKTPAVTENASAGEKMQKVVLPKPEKRPVQSAVVPAVDSAESIATLMVKFKKASELGELEKAADLRYRASVLVWEEKREIRRKKTEAKLRSEAFVGRKPFLESGDLDNMETEVMKSDSSALEKREANINEIEIELKELENILQKERRQASAATEKLTQEQIINDLISAQVISNKDNLSFRLHNMFLIVNGVEQSEFLHQKLKAKYLKYTWVEWVYNWDGATGYRFTGVRYNG